MNISWKLGRIAGIDLFLHPTFLLILIPGLLGGEPSLPLVVTLFGCVVLHELGHALMARRFGIETLDITLYPIGGVARLERMPRAPGAEILIALAGPAVNFAIAGLLIAFQSLSLGDGEPAASLGLLCDNLLVLNLVLGLFNLLPAFPMDGGRVLRALLSSFVGRPRATSIAASIGRAAAVAFGFYGLLHWNFLQLALAAFIYFAAGAEEAGVLADERRRATGERDEDIWSAPPGYRWVHRGNGVWQLAPIIVRAQPRPGASPWTH
ncbi:Putative zinc metalloprotease Rip3 [Aquisphaera giovannonii]|uniref:Zinc metalloprotease Rip3 n=1 Tax=Aquisphaera giovannonii TaxID=406548 RepID=A0A5B9W0F3_9BACT|nr:site-2 protease family protein [Aquisphaera giovannonii]QEH33684.1 Putative zinc metalloprotease Rip3 [Aquisphaera giovannonii]